MKALKLVSLLCVTTLLIGCSQVTRKDGVDTESKEYNLISTDRRELLIPNGRTALTDSFLVIASFQQPDVCRMYALYDHMKEFKYGKIGNGLLSLFNRC